MKATAEQSSLINITVLLDIMPYIVVHMYEPTCHS